MAESASLNRGSGTDLDAPGVEGTGDTNTTVLIADDHVLVRTGVQRLLEEIGCQIVAAVDNGEDAVAEVRAHHPDIALIDIHMPGVGGLEATRRIRRVHPGCRVIVLTAYTEGPLPRAFLAAGVAGFLTKGCALEEMNEAISKVRAGERYISRDMAQKLVFASVQGETDNPFDRLTARELQVALMLLGGDMNRDIAASLSRNRP